MVAADTGRKYYGLLRRGHRIRQKRIPSAENLERLHRRQARQARRNQTASSNHEPGGAVKTACEYLPFVVDKSAIDRHVKIGTFADLKGTLSARALVRRALLSWRRLIRATGRDVRTYRVDFTTQPELAAQRSRLAGGRQGYTPVDHLDRPVGIDAWRSFDVIESADEHCQIVDRLGNVLAYRYRLPAPLVDLLQAASDELGVRKHSVKGGQGRFPVRYYTIWKRQLNIPRYSGDYIDQRPQADRFLARIAPLLKRLAHDLRLISPQCHTRYRHLQRRIEAVGLRCLAGVWPGLNLNQRQTASQGVSVHKDFLDLPSGMNVVVPFGRWSGGDVVLWQVYKVVKLRPGDVLFFNGANLIHSGTPITDGVRNSLNLFGHQEVVEFFDDLAFTSHAKAAMHRIRAWDRAQKDVARPRPRVLSILPSTMMPSMARV